MIIYATGFEDEGFHICCYIVLTLTLWLPSAITSVRRLISSPDFDRKMILLAIRMANESDMKSLLLTTLEALLQTLKRGENLEDDMEAIMLIRCIIRLVGSLLDESMSNQQVFDYQEHIILVNVAFFVRIVLIPSLVQHFQTGQVMRRKKNRYFHINVLISQNFDFYSVNHQRCGCSCSRYFLVMAHSL
jgi:hypothetical protein